MGRVDLPDRRYSANREIEFKGSKFTVTVGFNNEGEPKEVFADGAKQGSALAAIVSDACVLVSVSLQHGISASELGESLGREPDPLRGQGADRPASPIGIIIEAVAEPLGAVVAGIREAI